MAAAGDSRRLEERTARRTIPMWVLTSIPFLGPFIGLANALAIFRENCKCLHDDLAGTKVIKSD